MMKFLKRTRMDREEDHINSNSRDLECAHFHQVLLWNRKLQQNLSPEKTMKSLDKVMILVYPQTVRTQTTKEMESLSCAMILQPLKCLVIQPHLWSKRRGKRIEFNFLILPPDLQKLTKASTWQCYTRRKLRLSTNWLRSTYPVPNLRRTRWLSTIETRWPPSMMLKMNLCVLARGKSRKSSSTWRLS